MSNSNASNSNDGSGRHHFYKPKRGSVISLTGFKQKPDGEDIPISKEDINHPIAAAVESGSSSFIVTICEVAPSGNTVLHRQEIDNNKPAQTLVECTRFLTKYKPTSGYHALGILSSSPTSTWVDVDLLTPLQEACQGSLPLKIKVETTSAVGLAQSALNGEDTLNFGAQKKGLVLGTLVGALVTTLYYMVAAKKK